MTARRWPLAVAAVLFVVVGVAGWRGLDPDEREVEPLGAAVVLLVLGPATTALNGAEYAAVARLLGHRVGPADAVRVAVLGSAANLLPLPGAVLVRADALRRHGTSVKGAAGASAVAAVVWAGTAATVAGALQLVDGDAGLGAALTAAGAVALAAGVALALRTATRAGGQRSAAGGLVAIEAATVVVGAARLMLVAAAVGFADASVLNVAGVVAAAAGVLPGGLGLREAVAAALAPLVDASAAVGAAAATLDRLLGLPTVAVGALVLLRGRANGTPAPATPPAPQP